jgi:hypothetical protein
MRQILFVRWEQDEDGACFALHRFTTIRACLRNTRLHLAIALKVTQSWSEFGWRGASKVHRLSPPRFSETSPSQPSLDGSPQRFEWDSVNSGHLIASTSWNQPTKDASARRDFDHSSLRASGVDSGDKPSVPGS